jgi:hypothetical protein
MSFDYPTGRCQRLRFHMKTIISRNEHVKNNVGNGADSVGTYERRRSRRIRRTMDTAIIFFLHL